MNKLIANLVDGGKLVVCEKHDTAMKEQKARAFYSLGRKTEKPCTFCPTDTSNMRGFVASTTDFSKARR